MEAVNVTIWIDKHDRDLANELFKELGMTLNSAVNMFIKQSLRERAIPFKASCNSITFVSDKEAEEISKKIIKKSKGI